MVSLTSVGRRFEITFTVIENGSGLVTGLLSETDQSSQPSYVFVQPRHVLRATAPTAIRAGMVLLSPAGAPFIVGANGPSEQPEGKLWESFRLFEPTGRYALSRRTQIMDPIAKQMREGPPEDLGLIWAALESIDREQEDRAMRVNVSQSRVITGAALRLGDLVDNRPVTKVDKELGVTVGVLT